MATTHAHAPFMRVAKYTQKDSNVNKISIKASIFRLMWTHIRSNATDCIARLDALEMFAVQDRNDFKTELLDNKPRVKLLRKLEEKLLAVENPIRPTNLLLCNEDEVLNAMIEMIASAKKKQTVLSAISTLRQAFRQIGRENSWADRWDIQEYGLTFACSGNPVTDHVRKELVKIVKLAEATVEIPLPTSHGGCATLPLVNWYTTQLLAKFITKSKSTIRAEQSVKAVVNLGQLNVLMMFLMHTGARPGNIVSRLKYSDLVFYGMDKPACWLTLAFIKTSTLTEIIEKDVIQLYGMNLYKGSLTKGGGEILKWQKTTVPASYNMLDLPYVFAIIWRVLLKVSPDTVFANDGHVFAKKEQAYSKKFKALNDIYKISNFVFYSMRYGSAKEDVESGLVPDDVTSERMSHTEKSDIAKEVYATCDNVIKIEDKKIETVMPVKGDTDSGITGLVWAPIRPFARKTIVYKQDFWEKSGLSEEAILDFQEVNDLVIEAVMNNSESARATLLEKDPEGLGIRELPLGMHYTYPTDALPARFMVFHKDALKILEKNFKPVKKPLIIPELAYLSQVIYGNWRNLKGDNAFTTRMDRKVNAIAIAEGAQRKSKDDVATATPKRKNNEAITKSRKRVKTPKRVVDVTPKGTKNRKVAAKSSNETPKDVPETPKEVEETPKEVEETPKDVRETPKAQSRKRGGKKRKADAEETKTQGRTKDNGEVTVCVKDLNGRLVHEKFDDGNWYWGIVQNDGTGYVVHFSDGEIRASSLEEVELFLQPEGTVWPEGIDKPSF